MTALATPPVQRPPTGARVALLATAGVMGLMAMCLLALGTISLWGESKRDAQGYISTGSDRYQASTYALSTDDLDVDGDVPGWLVDEDAYGELRLRVDSAGDEPVFVGIAPTADVDGYLAGTDHTELSDVDYSPFEPTYRDHQGARRPAAPGDEGFWTTSTQGPGEQTLDWDVQAGHWSVVVMNADGSRGVDAGVSAGLKVSFLGPLGWSLLGGGALFLLAAGGLLYSGVRKH